MQEAIERAIDDCIEKHILEEFLKSRREEVVKVTQLDYTWERREELIRKEEYEEGLEVGTQRGIEQGIAEARLDAIETMIKKKYLNEDILDLGYTDAEYQVVEQKLQVVS